MAETRTCDRCGGPGALQMAVSIAISSAVKAGAATAHTAAADACDTCRADVARILQEHAIAQLNEQIPFHKTIEAKSAELLAAQAEFEAIRPTLQAHDTDATPVPTELAAERDAILERMTAAEEARLEAVQQGTAVSDQRQAGLAAALRA